MPGGCSALFSVPGRGSGLLNNSQVTIFHLPSMSLVAVTCQRWRLAVLLPLRTSHIFSKNKFIFKNKNQLSLLRSNFPGRSQNLASSQSERLDSSNFTQKSPLPAGDRKPSAWLHTLNSLNLVGTPVIIVFCPRGLAYKRIHL